MCKLSKLSLNSNCQRCPNFPSSISWPLVVQYRLQVLRAARKVRKFALQAKNGAAFETCRGGYSWRSLGGVDGRKTAFNRLALRLQSEGPSGTKHQEPGLCLIKTFRHSYPEAEATSLLTLKVIKLSTEIKGQIVMKTSMWQTPNS